MKKLVIFANQQFKEYLFAEMKDKKYSYLKEIPKNRINLSNGTRYTFEILDYSSNVEAELKRLEGEMLVLNISNPIKSTMDLY
ncbi:hypothetical protein Q4303_15490 [Acinetobacter baumannii]|uniref:hypothetical protein n=1 Tax=Acinetobacter calcoaceticus/baumannii complex TaxID=909768 RepID=UPI000DA66F8F|nr:MULTISPECIES: hypothetical protein [Acinetobacter calcoaceticus/baumannii complex]MDP7845794.1 hypothetical protein [Acinetobacter pittii]MDP7869940.1 hypothetical protein [Acinetobacter pittii]UFN54578.1 hypothetical protein LPS07_05555 [Acinetobacter pittii]